MVNSPMQSPGVPDTRGRAKDHASGRQRNSSVSMSRSRPASRQDKFGMEGYFDAPPLARTRSATAQDLDSGEYIPVDRGEELVRKRMKERERARDGRFKQKKDLSASMPVDHSHLHPGTQSLRQQKQPSPYIYPEGFGGSLGKRSFGDRRGQWPLPLDLDATTRSNDLQRLFAPSSLPGTPSVSKKRPGGASDSIRSSRRDDASSLLQEEDEESESGGPGREASQDGDASDTEGAENGTDNSQDAEDSDQDVEYTLKDRQDAINIEHPFGLRIWKPALYKKKRSVQDQTERAIHAVPSLAATHFSFANCAWALTFGLVLFAVSLVASLILVVLPWGGPKYAGIVVEMGLYLLWPFGKYVEGWVETFERSGEAEQVLLEREDSDMETHAPLDEESAPTERTGLTENAPTDSGRSYGTQGATNLNDDNGNQGQHEPASPTSSSNGNASFATAGSDRSVHHLPYPHPRQKKRVRALGRVIYWVLFYVLIAPFLLLIAAICWLLIVTLPMSRLLWTLFRHMSKEPLSMYFKSVKGRDGEIRPGQPAPPTSAQDIENFRAHGRLYGPHSVVLLCVYDAAGLRFLKYTVEGVNIIFVNLLFFVVFVIMDFFLLVPYVEKHALGGILGFLANRFFIFIAALASIIPLSYFIGMAVASISAQSSIGMGAVLNASFGSIVEILLYCMALTRRKGALVEGSLVGSLMASILLLPGISMVAAGIIRKEQHFNSKSAGVTTTMLMMSMIGILTPTVFYEMYGTFELNCSDCHLVNGETRCTDCTYEHIDPDDDEFYKSTVCGLALFCGLFLVLSYLISLWFSLRTHASQIWQNQNALEQQYFPEHAPAIMEPDESQRHDKDHEQGQSAPPPEAHGGHESANWSRRVSAIVLLTCTVLFAIIAEVLVDEVDALVSGNSSISEKILGLTLFSLVPSTTEFMNAISFAVYGNISLSLEIGSAYAMQVCLIQIPAMLAFSTISSRGKPFTPDSTFTLIWPRFDMFAIAVAVLLITYTYIESRANYQRGSILILAYVIIIGAFWAAPNTSDWASLDM